MSQTDVDIEDLPEDYEFYEGENEEGESIREEQPIVYNTEDFISTYFLSENCTLPENILEFHYSYGYDCKRPFNLVLADEETAIFASGNLINFFNLNTKQIWFRRSYLGGGIGHITKNHNPEYNHLAVAENGINPPIIIYEWPHLDIKHILKGGTSAIYSHLNYSPDGMLLASQGGEPDHLITIWDWPNSKIMLRTKSYVSDVHRVLFSPYVPGHLCTCGLSHIKFWKMANSFTGLKLQGELGRFGKTEYTDILGIYGMPDEKVISGCSWGNILIWEAGLIKIEVFRQLRKKCHNGPIVQFEYKNGELWTVGMDGRVRVWSYDVIDQADPPDDDRVVQIEPVYDFYTPNVEFMCIHKLHVDITDTYYIAQDGNGGLWKIDLPTLTLEVRPSVQLYKCHAGKIVDISTCPWTIYLASLGEDGRLYIYNYVTLELMFEHQFPAKGRAIIWLPMHITKSGNQILMAFDDGNLRSVIIDMTKESTIIKMKLTQVIKPHNKPITCMSINKKGTVIVTGGEDATIFIMQINQQKKSYPNLVPIGYVHVPGIVTCLNWHHEQINDILIGCIHGHVVQVHVPELPQFYTTITYILDLDSKRINQRFTTYKSQIRRQIKIDEIEARKAAKRDKKRIAMEEMLKENPGLEIDEEIYLADSESEEELEPLHIPEIPNKVLWLQSTEDDTIWLSMGGYDAGYIYEYNMKQKDIIPLKCTIICDGDDIEISNYVYNYNKKYMILAMQHGQIRVVKVNPDDFKDLSDYWQISMHDNLNGFIPKMCFSYDEKLFFSCGHDGNIFSYIYNPEYQDYVTAPKIIEPEPPTYVVVEDVVDYKTLSLEEEIVKRELDRRERVANANKNAVLNKIDELRKQFEELLVRNSKLLPTQIIPREDLEIDPRVTEDLQRIIDEEMELEKRKLAYQVEKSEVAMKKLMKYCTDPLDVFPFTISAIEEKIVVNTTRQRLLILAFYRNLALVEKKILEQELKGRPPEREKVIAKVPPPPSKIEKPLEYFLLGLSQSTIQKKLGIKLTRTLAKYRVWRMKIEKRQQEWERFKTSKPLEGINQPEDIAGLQYAIETIGDYKLKSAADYKVPPHLRENKLKKYKELLLTREKAFEERKQFNCKVYKLRTKKIKLIDKYKKLHGELVQIQKEITQGQVIIGPSVPEISKDHYPEKNIELDIQMPKEYQDPPSATPLLIVPEPSRELLEKEVLPYVDVDLYEETLETPWEIEARTMRLERKLYQQNELIKEMKGLIRFYDAKIANIMAEKHEMLIRAVFLDIHVLALHQELLVLTKFEANEDKLSNAVNTNLLECMMSQDVITKIENKIETHKAAIDVLLEKEKQIQNQFYSSIADNKFSDFLRRIFKKKYKPPKEHDPDESDSESSSSSSSDESDEEDAASVDSRDFGIIKLDDSVCPKGCDKRLYDLSFTLRGQRHEVELAIKEHRNGIDALKKEEEIKMKQIRVLEGNLKVSQDELEAFQREKQKKLNEVDKTIILRLHQIQCFTDDHVLPDAWDTLLFNKMTLSRLYKRVGQLQLETLQQKAKHKVNITHLQRMTTDCKYMMRTIDSLRESINELLIQKFGSVVDIDDVEEAYLKKLVYDLRMSQTDIKSLYVEEMQYWKNNFEETQIKLANVIKENTSKLDLLVILTRERIELEQSIDVQKRKKIHITSVIDITQDCRDDIQKLMDIVKNQKQHLQDLKDEIKTLKTKGLPVKSEIERRLFEPLQPDIEDADSLDWIGYDEYVKTEYVEYEEVEETEQKQIIKMPSVISEKAEDIAIGIITEMFDNLERSDIITEGILRNLVRTVMNRSSVNEIIDELMSVISFQITEEQTSIIETSAEKLYTIQEPEIGEEDIESCIADTIAQITEEIFTLFEVPCDIVIKILLVLLQELPLKYLLKKTSIDCLVEKLRSVLPCIDKRQLAEGLASITSPYIKDIKRLLDSILVEVFGTGLDYLYILPEKSCQ